MTAQGDHTTSTGQNFSASEWLDDHYTMARPEYEAMCRAAGFRPGWRVLDAGCGGGAFLPLLAELVGPGGRLAALDLAPENVAAVEARVAAGALPCPVEARVGGLTALPYPDAAFDGAWCANVTQYLTDDELAVALAEFRRVVRPGGIVAVKELDAALTRIAPAPPLLLGHYFAAAARAGRVASRGILRTPGLPGALRRAGLGDVRFATTLVERTPPLDDATRRVCGGLLGLFAGPAAGHDLPEADRAFWAGLREEGGVARFLAGPDLIFTEGHALVVGRVPEG